MYFGGHCVFHIADFGECGVCIVDVGCAGVEGSVDQPRLRFEDSEVR